MAAAGVAALVHLASVPLARFMTQGQPGELGVALEEIEQIDPASITEIALPEELPPTITEELVRATHPSEQPPPVETRYVADQNSNPARQSRLLDPGFGTPELAPPSPTTGGQASAASTPTEEPPAPPPVEAPLAARPAGTASQDGEVVTPSDEEAPTVAARAVTTDSAAAPARVDTTTPPAPAATMASEPGLTAMITLPTPAGGDTEDDLSDLPIGDQSAVAARRTDLAVLLQAVRDRVRPHWRAREIYPRLDPTWRFSDKSLITSVKVRLAADGLVEDAQVVRGSGLAQMDQEAVAAFARANRFTAPPRSVLDDQGGVSFTMDMVFEVVVHSFRARTREQLASLWRPSPAFQRNGDHERVTTARVLVTADGVLARASVVGSAGIDFLDQGVMEALRAGVRLPRPPASYREVEGLTALWIEFHHNVRRTSIIKVLSPSERPQLLRAAND